MNAFYAEELGNIDNLFHTDAANRDSVHGDAMANLYASIVDLVRANADQTPVATQNRIEAIVRAWRLKFEFSPGKFRNLPRHDQPPASLSTFLERAVASGTVDLLDLTGIKWGSG
jgi:hypothetical protein